MTTPNPLVDYLKGKEWYDNSTLDTIDKCIRKGFWKTTFTLPQSADEKAEDISPGVSDNVGVGAHVGSAFHAAWDKFYSPLFFATKTYEQRRLTAIRSLIKKYQQLIAPDDEVESAYQLARCVNVFDLYCDRYREEDHLYEPVETEIAIVVTIAPRPNDPYQFVPFLYVARLDAIWKRKRFDDLYVVEHKTTKSPENKRLELIMSRQGRGYFFTARQFEGELHLMGLLTNILTIRAAENDPDKLFFRDYIDLAEHNADDFRLQTINKVTRWRHIKQLAAAQPTLNLQLAMYDQTTSECTRYGKCSYYDLCLYGPNGADLTKYKRNTWNPLYSEKADE